MKRSLAMSLLLLLAISYRVYADVTKSVTSPASPVQSLVQRQPQTKLEALLGTRGLLFLRDGNDIGTIDGVDIAAITVYTPGHENEKTRGFVLTASDNLTTITVYVDYDEAKSLTQALSYMQGLSDKWRNQTIGYKEADFLTAGGLGVRFYHTEDGKHQDAVVNLTDIAMVSTSMKDTDFNAFKDMINQGLNWLDKQ